MKTSTPPGSLRAAHAAQTRARLLDAAIGILSDEGVGELSLREVAKVAGVSVPTVYRHFPRVDDLITGVLDEFQRQMMILPVPTTIEEFEAALPSIHAGFQRKERALTAYLRARSAFSLRVAGRQRRARYVLDAVTRSCPLLSVHEASVLAAVLQLFSNTGTWDTWNSVWGLSGEPAGHLSAWVVSVLAREIKERPAAFRAVARELPHLALPPEEPQAKGRRKRQLDRQGAPT